MGRRRLYISIGLIAGFVALVLVGLIAMAKREPSFYVDGDLPPGETRIALSSEAKSKFSRFSNLFDDADSNDPVKITAEQINAFFQEDYLHFGGDENLPDGFHQPRVRIEDGRMRLGVRYGKGITSTVLSLEIKVWKVEGAVNTLAMEIVNMQAGSLPLSTGTILDDISTAARRWNIDITWYRDEGHPVAVMRFQSHLTRPTFQFESIELKDGSLTIAGRSTDQAPAPMPRLASR